MCLRNTCARSVFAALLLPCTFFSFVCADSILASASQQDEQGWQMDLPASNSGCSVLTFQVQSILPTIRISAPSHACPIGDLRAFINIHRASSGALDLELSRLQAKGSCTVSHVRETLKPASILWQGPVDGMPGPPARVALLQINSNCSANASITVQVESPASVLSLGKASARRFLQAAYSIKFAAPSPDAPYSQAPSPLPGAQLVQTPNQTQVSDQAMRPSGPGLWALGNKSRSGNNTSGDLLYSTDQQPAMWSAPAPLPPPGPPQAAVQCCCFNNTGNPFANPNQVQGCCCGLQQDCCPSTVGGLAVCRGKGQYCFVVVVVCSMVMVFIVCIMALAWWTHRTAMRRRAVMRAQLAQGAVGGGSRVEMVPKKAVEQPASMDGRARECPVCWDKFVANREWVLFQCQHGTCVPCYQRLLQQPSGAASCPLCRLPLMEPAPSTQHPQSQTLQQ